MTVVVSTINERTAPRPLVALCDSSSTATWISHKALPKNTQGTPVKPIKGSTLAGVFESSFEASLSDVRLPALFCSRSIGSVCACVFSSPCCYDLIIGRDILAHIGLIVDFNDKVLIWDDSSIPMTSKSIPQETAAAAAFIDS